MSNKVTAGKLVKITDLIDYLVNIRDSGIGNTCVFFPRLCWGASALWANDFAKADEIEDLATRPTFAGPVEYTIQDWRDSINYRV